MQAHCIILEVGCFVVLLVIAYVLVHLPNKMVIWHTIPFSVNWPLGGGACVAGEKVTFIIAEYGQKLKISEIGMPASNF